MTDFPKDGSWFATEQVIRTVYRWRAYKPQAVKQMGKPGRWQKQVWNGGFFKWENCEAPEGALCDALESEGPISPRVA